MTAVQRVVQNSPLCLAAETQFILMQTREDGPYVVLLPLIDSATFRATLRPPRLGIDAADDLCIRIESGDAAVKAAKWEHALYIAAGSDPFALLDAAVARAAAMSGGAKPLWVLCHVDTFNAAWAELHANIITVRATFAPP